MTILKHIDGTGFVPASRAIINEVVLSVCFNMVHIKSYSTGLAKREAR